MTQVDQVEQAFELLSYIVATGASLQEAFLFDNNRRTDLPLAAFDGQPLLEPLQQLERDWQGLLSYAEKEDSAPVYPALIEWACIRTTSYEQPILNRIQLIDRFKALLVRTHTHIFHEFRRRELSQHYQKQIDYHESQTRSLRRQQQHLESRLNELLALSVQ